jgi:lysophospholipase L1-like esterase
MRRRSVNVRRPYPRMNKLLLTLLSLLFLAGCQTVQKPVAPLVGQPVAAAPAVALVDPFWPADGVFPVPGHTSSWSGFRAKNVERRTLFSSQKATDQSAIVFVGDSITEGWHTLQQDFAGLGVKVANRGIGGDTTPNLIYRLQEDVLSLHPRALVILIGTNDLGEHTTPEQIAENLAELHRRIRAAYPTIPLAWCLVMPRKGEDSYPERIHDLNARIAKLAETDAHVTVCDTFTPLALPDGSSNPEDFVPDRLHLNPTGYATWRTALMPILTGWALRPE